MCVGGRGRWDKAEFSVYTKLSLKWERETGGGRRRLSSGRWEGGRQIWNHVKNEGREGGHGLRGRGRRKESCRTNRVGK